MAQRNIWKGAITFGMVSIPSKLYSATEDARISLHQYHKDCGSHILCPSTVPPARFFMKFKRQLLDAYSASNSEEAILLAEGAGSPNFSRRLLHGGHNRQRAEEYESVSSEVTLQLVKILSRSSS